MKLLGAFIAGVVVGAVGTITALFVLRADREPVTMRYGPFGDADPYERPLPVDARLHDLQREWFREAMAQTHRVMTDSFPEP